VDGAGGRGTGWEACLTIAWGQASFASNVSEGGADVRRFGDSLGENGVTGGPPSYDPNKYQGDVDATTSHHHQPPAFPRGSFSSSSRGLTGDQILAPPAIPGSDKVVRAVGASAGSGVLMLGDGWSSSLLYVCVGVLGAVPRWPAGRAVC
jgi:hypothetical protein